MSNKTWRKDPYKYIKAGPALDLPGELANLQFRSSWERNIARLLLYLGIKFRYECKRFYFNTYCDSYLPDFFLIDDNPWDIDWIEVKGFWKPGDKRKIMLFNKEFPNESLHVIARKEYMKLQKQYRDKIPTWER